MPARELAGSPIEPQALMRGLDGTMTMAVMPNAGPIPGISIQIPVSDDLAALLNGLSGDDGLPADGQSQSMPLPLPLPISLTVARRDGTLLLTTVSAHTPPTGSLVT